VLEWCNAKQEVLSFAKQIAGLEVTEAIISPFDLQKQMNYNNVIKVFSP
jgi:hypothetical protein